MNHIYRTLWSVSTQSWQAVPENARTGGKKSTSSAAGVVASVALGFALSGAAHAQSPPALPPAINQLPTGGSVARGTATLSQTATAQAAAMTVNQSSQRAVINWSSFNLGQSASVNFVQPNAQAVTLNRVNDSNPSQIFGRITANGQVFLSNANGVYFSPTSSVDVGAFTATTHSISDDNFMSGNYVFERNGSTGKITNEGNINAALGGYVALLAPEVQNAGVVVAKAGTVALAAGELITLNIDNNGSLAGITTTPSAIASLIENKLAVQAPDGQIILSAVGLSKLQTGVIKNSGSLEANSINNKGGKVYLEGDDITLSSTSKIEAKGPAGGGTVLVGGDWQGSGDMRQATKVTMEAGATIDASATDKGDGGKVVLWSDIHNADSVTRVSGSIKAEAGLNGGDGGKVETSGHVLNVNGIHVSTQATVGNAGDWLLDPSSISIVEDSAQVNGSYTTGSTISGSVSGTDAVIGVGTINTALQNNTTVILQTEVLTQSPTTTAPQYDINLNATSQIVIPAGKTLKLLAQYQNGGRVQGSTPIQVNGTLAMKSGSSPNVLSGMFSGNGVITMDRNYSASTWIYTNDNTFSGIVKLYMADLYLGNGGTTGSFNYATKIQRQATGYASSTYVYINRSDATTFSVPLDNSLQTGGGIYAVGAGEVTLTSTITPSTGTQTAFKFYASGNGRLRLGADYSSIVGDLYLSNLNGVTGNQSPQITFGDGVGGNAGLPPTSAATVTIYNSSTYNLSPRLIFERSDTSAYSLSKNITLSNSNIALTMSSTSSAQLNYSGILATGASTTGNQIIVAGSGPVAFSQPISGAGSFRISNATGVTLNGANTYTGSTTIDAATSLAIGGSGTLGSGTYAGNIFNDGALYYSSSSNQTLSGVISGGGTLTKDTSSTSKLTLTGINTYSGATTVSAGTLALTNASALGTTAAGTAVTAGATLDLQSVAVGAETVTLSGGTLQNSTGLSSLSGGVSLTADSVVNVVTQLTLSGVVSGANGLTKTGGGILLLSNANTYSGATTVSAGTLAVSNSSGLGTTASGTTVASGATLDLQGVAIGMEAVTLSGGSLRNSTGTSSLSGDVSLTADSVVNVSSQLTLSGVVSGTNGLTKTGVGTLLLSNANTYSGATTVSAGTLAVSNSSGLGTTASGTTVASGATLDLRGVSIGGEAIALSGGTLTNSTGTSILSGDVNLSSSGTVDVGAGLSLTLSGVVSGSNTLTKVGSGTLILSNANTYSGTTTVSGGTLAVTNALGLGTTDAGTSVAVGATLDLRGVEVGNEAITLGGTLKTSTGTSGLNGNVSLTASSTIDVGGTQLALNGVVSGANSLTKTGAGILVLGNANTYSGTTTISEGTLQAGSPTAFGTGNITETSGAVLDLNGQTMTSAGNLTLSGTGISSRGALINSRSTGATYAGLVSLGLATTIKGETGTITLSNVGTISGATYGLTLDGSAGGSIASIIGTTSGTLTKLGTGTWSLTGANTYTGTTTINAGTLQIGNGGATGTLGTGLIYDNAVLYIQRSGTYSLSTVASNAGAITGTGNIKIESTTGALTINRDITLSGASSRIDLLANSSAAAGSSMTNDLTLSNTITTSNTGTINIFAGSPTTVSTNTLLSMMQGATGALKYKTYNATSAAALSGAVLGTRNFYYRQTDALSFTGATFTKTYDGTNAITGAAVTGGTFSNAIDFDTFTASFNSGTYASSNVGSGITVTSTPSIVAPSGSGWSLAGYTVTPSTYSGTITAKGLTVTGTSVANKVYDGTNAAILSGGSLVGVVGNENITLIQVGTFAQSGVGTGIAVTATDSLGGTGVGNYTLTQPVLANANITAKALGLSIPGATRVYDGTTTISPSGPVTLIGVVGTDQVNLGAGNVTGYVDKNVGTNKTVTYTGLALSGGAASNYTLPVNPTSNANITPAALSIAGITASDKTYDGDVTATVNTANVVKSGLIAGDVVSVATTGSFIDKNAGSGKTVNLLSSYTGTDAGNYTITDQLTTTASIAKASLTVTAVDAAKNFGSANPAFSVTVSGYIPGETAATSGVTGTGLATTTATDLTVAGTVPIVASVGTLTAANYAFTKFVDGTLTIKPISAMNNTEVTTLIGAQLSNLTGSQVGSFSTTQLQVFSPKQLGALSPSQVAGLTITQLLSLTPDQLAAISPAKIASMAPDQLAGLSASQFAGLTTSQLQALSAAQIAAISTAQLGQLSSAQITALTSNAAASLSFQQIAALTPAQIVGVNPVEVASFTATQIGALSIPQLKALSLLQLAAISPANLSSLTPQQIAGLTSNAAASLSFQQIAALAPTQIVGVDAVRVASLTAAEIGSLSDAQLQALSLLQIAAIAPDHFSALSPAQIMALSITQVINLTPDQLRGFTPAQVASLSAAELAYFDARQLAAIGIVPKTEAPLAQAPVPTPAAAPSVEATVPAAIATSNQLPLNFETPNTPVEQVAASDASTTSTVSSASEADANDARNKFQAAIPVMTAVAGASAPAAVPAAAPTPIAAELTTATATTAVTATTTATATAAATTAQAAPAAGAAQSSPSVTLTAAAPQTGVLAITILSNAEPKPTTVGVAFEQDGNSVTLRTASAPPTPPASDKLTFNDKLTSFMVSSESGGLIEFKASLVNRRLVILAQSSAARQIARTEMNVVLAAAITSLGAENRVMLANLDGVVLDLR